MSLKEQVKKGIAIAREIVRRENWTGHIVGWLERRAEAESKRVRK